MLKRNVILGSLIAGAFLLPGVVGATVNGPCANCHTMHDSQNGTAVNTGVNSGQHAQLLKGDGCVGCHADATNNTDTTKGVPAVAGGVNAPQVDYNAASLVNAGGYFTKLGADNLQHNVAGLTSADVAMVTAGTYPGSTHAYNAANELTCQSCHTASGGHHSTGANYRLLGNAAATTTTSYNPGTGVGVFPGDREVLVYNAANMNAVCSNCHTDFHVTAQVGGAWLRHPTDVTISTSTAPSVPASITPTDAVVVGDAAATQVVMCLSCHVAHGGPNADLLSFTYGGSASYAGDGIVSGSGCETCHTYAANGAGM